jgi:hypothetical protein
MAAILANRLGGGVEIGSDEVAPVLGVEVGREAGRPDQIVEHPGHGPSLRLVSRAGRGDRRGRRRLQRQQTGDRLQDALSRFGSNPVGCLKTPTARKSVFALPIAD